MFLHIIDAHVLSHYKIELEFNDGKKGVADLSDALEGEVFQPLKDPELFTRLKVDAELETIVWPNGVDLAPEYLYFKAFRDDPLLQSQFKKWGYIS